MLVYLLTAGCVHLVSDMMSCDWQPLQSTQFCALYCCNLGNSCVHTGCSPTLFWHITIKDASHIQKTSQKMSKTSAEHVVMNQLSVWAFFFSCALSRPFACIFTPREWQPWGDKLASIPPSSVMYNMWRLWECTSSSSSIYALHRVLCFISALQ